MTITAESVSRTREGQPEKLRRSLRGDLDTIVLQASAGKKDQFFTANVYPMLGNIRMAQGKLDAARKDQEHGAEIRGKSGQVEAEAQSQLNLAALAIETGQFEAAGRLAGEAEGKFQQGKGHDFATYAKVVEAESLVGALQNFQRHRRQAAENHGSLNGADITILQDCLAGA
jgi:ATP/maltotriose-dependent transcriptional regulator MalT